MAEIRLWQWPQRQRIEWNRGNGILDVVYLGVLS